jgi:microcystin-dependent protein
MSNPYVGEIRMFAGNFAPTDWALCNGALLSISQNTVLFDLIGTTYGGDGQSTFALPNLNGAVPIHAGNSGASTYIIGQSGGVSTVTLTSAQIPSHSHTVTADSNPATTPVPTNAYLAASAPYAAYTEPNGSGNPDATLFRTMNPSMLATTGGGQPHQNMQPFLAITYIISLFGIFPSPS